MSYIPTPPNRPLWWATKPSWWEEYLRVEKNPASYKYRYHIRNKETLEFVGDADTFEQLNQLAEEYLHKLFEKIVLSND